MSNWLLNYHIAAALVLLAGCGEGSTPQSMADVQATVAPETVAGSPSLVDPEPMTGSLWNYEASAGPSFWSEMSPDYSLCSKGLQQSPLDLSEDSVIENDSRGINPKYVVAGTQLVNNGHSLQVNFPAGNTLHFSGSDYQLVQFHLHTPSEHLINGVPAAMEAHLVHQNLTGKVLVLSALLRSGGANPWLARMLASAPAHGKSSTLPTGINPNELLPKDLEETEAYSYTGSFTTPPCAEGVTWMVMADAGTVSRAQATAFKALNGANARPVQPRNGRLIDEYYLGSPERD